MSKVQTQVVSVDKPAGTAAVKVSQGAPRPRTGQNSFLGNLSVGQKLALAGLLAGVPFVGALVSLVNQSNSQLRILERQLVGQRMIPSLQNAMVSTQLVRLSSFNVLQGDQAAQAKLEQQRQQLSSSLKALQASAQQAGYSTVVKNTTTALQALETLNWSVDSASMQPAEAQAAYTDLLRNSIQPIFSQVAVASGLKVSTNLALSEMANTVTAVLPDNLPTAGAIFSGTLPAISGIGAKGSAIPPEARQQVRQQWEASNQAINTILQEIQTLGELDPATQANLKGISESFRGNANTILGAIDDGVLTPGRLDISAAELSAMSPNFANDITKLSEQVTNNYGRLLNQETARQRRTVTLLILSALLLTALLAGLLYLISRSITQPLGRLTEASQRLSRGELEVSVPVTTRDELGTLSNSFNTAAQQLRENAQRVEQERVEAQRLQQNVGEFLDVTMDIADGDLTKRGKVTEDVLGNVVDSINLMVDELADTLRGVQDASNSVTGGSRTMLMSTAEIEQGASVTAAETQRVAQQAQQINAQIQEMARIAQASAEAAQQALLASQQGQEAVSSTLSGMNTIRESTQSVSERVQSLAQRSEQIQEILDSINHIASQTNLLSLHASIEAAGAGEAGNRFTVVAEEVRQLADESAAATSRIATLVQSIQAEIREVSESMRASAQQVEEGYEVAGQAGQRLQQIGELSEQSARLAQLISQAAGEQVRGVESVGQGVQQIAQIAERSQQSVQQGRSAAEQLQQLAQQLSGSLSRFRLPSNQ